MTILNYGKSPYIILSFISDTIKAAGITYLPRKGTPVSDDFTRARKPRAGIHDEYGRRI